MANLLSKFITLSILCIERFSDNSVFEFEKCSIDGTASSMYKAECLMKTAEAERRKPGDANYSWLTSKSHLQENNLRKLAEIQIIAEKSTPEACAAIAAKLGNLVDNTEDIEPDYILKSLKNLLEESRISEMIKRNVLANKEGRTIRISRVRPELSPPREATVSFIIETDHKCSM